MASKRITVGVVNWFSTDFFVDLFHSLEANASESDLEYIICDNTNGHDRQLYETFSGNCQIIPYAPIVPKIWRRKRRFGSYAHGLGLNLLLSQVKTEFCLFVDPDCQILAKGWDVVCTSSLSDSCIAIGAPYHSSKILKYHSFPSPIFIFFKTEVLRTIKADWTPFAQSVTEEIPDSILRIFSVLGGWLGERLWGRSFYTSHIADQMRRLLGNSSKDTGWKIQNQVRNEGYSAQLLKPAVKKQQLASPFSENSSIIYLMDDFELFLWRGIPFLSHYYGFGHRKKLDVAESTARWRSLVSNIDDAIFSMGDV